MRCSHCRSTMVVKDQAGFFTCAACGTVAENVRATERDAEDVMFDYTGAVAGDLSWGMLRQGGRAKQRRMGPETPVERFYSSMDFTPESRRQRQGTNITEADLLWSLQELLRDAIRDATDRYGLGQNGRVWEHNARYVFIGVLRYFRRTGLTFRSYFADSAAGHMNVAPERVPGLLQDAVPSPQPLSLPPATDALAIELLDRHGHGNVAHYINWLMTPDATLTKAEEQPVMSRATPPIWDTVEPGSNVRYHRSRWRDWSGRRVLSRQLGGCTVARLRAEVRLRQIESFISFDLGVYTANVSQLVHQRYLMLLIYLNDLLVAYIRESLAAVAEQKGNWRDNPVVQWMRSLPAFLFQREGHDNRAANRDVVWARELVECESDSAALGLLQRVREAVGSSLVLPQDLAGESPWTRVQVIMHFFRNRVWPEDVFTEQVLKATIGLGTADDRLTAEALQLDFDARIILPILLLSAQLSELPVLASDILRWANDGRLSVVVNRLGYSKVSWVTQPTITTGIRPPGRSTMSVYSPKHAQELHPFLAVALSSSRSLQNQSKRLYSVLINNPEAELPSVSDPQRRRLTYRFIKLALLPPELYKLAWLLSAKYQLRDPVELGAAVIVAARLHFCQFRHRSACAPRCAWSQMLVDLAAASTDVAADLRHDLNHRLSFYNVSTSPHAMTNRLCSTNPSTACFKIVLVNGY